MTRFTKCLAFVLQWEGGYVNHKNDHGGATNRGITQANYDAWRIRNGLSRNPVSGISGAEVDAIYRAGYWDAIRADELVDPIDLCVFDAAVQHGPSRAAKWLQRVVGTLQDGKIGSKTLHALAIKVEADGLNEVLDDYMAIRDGFYHEIVNNDVSQYVFMKGWMNRMASLREALG
jgi:lysozyme family protein